jgi:hypothetical protein
MFTTASRLISCAALLAASAFAGSIYNVSIDTAPLIGHTAGPFTLDLQFTDGSGSGDANNTVTLSNFLFGAGNPVGTPEAPLGGVSGDLGSMVTMTDSSFFNEFDQVFTPGATLTFRLALTNNADSGSPDEFSLGILDNTGVEIPTLDPGGALLVVDITPGSTVVSTFATDGTLSPAAGGSPISIPAPTVTPVSGVPEPGTLMLFAAGLLVLRRFGPPARSRR